MITARLGAETLDLESLVARGQACLRLAAENGWLAVAHSSRPPPRSEERRAFAPYNVRIWSPPAFKSKT
jgi:hypothetical protein